MTTLTASPRAYGARRDRRPRRTALVPTAVLLLGALYALLPVAWVVVASTKNNTELFNLSAFKPGSALFSNLSTLTSYRGGIFWSWMWNTAIYAGGGAILSAGLSALTGYTFAKYQFRGKSVLFNLILIGVLVPAVVLAVPQYLLVAKLNLADTYWSVLIPSIVSPYGIYLARIYAGASVHWIEQHAVTLVVGNPAAVRLRVNGRNPIPPGSVTTVTLALRPRRA